MAKFKYHLKGIGRKNKQIREQRKKPFPLSLMIDPEKRLAALKSIPTLKEKCFKCKKLFNANEGNYKNGSTFYCFEHL